jgi:hypothetical protein
MTYNCNICKKEYKSYKTIWQHNNHFHPNEVIHITPNDNKVRNFQCTQCNKPFTTKQSMLIHMGNNCKKKINDSEQMKNKIVELEKKIAELANNQNNKNTTISGNNNTNNTNNGTINNNNVQIIINKIGTENINDLNEVEVKEIFWSGALNNLESLVKFIQYLNFNSRLPSNHNFCTTSLDGQYLNIYNTEKSEQQKERKKYFFEDLLSRSVSKMEQLYNKYKTQFNNMKRKKIEEDINTLKMIRDRDMNDNLLREMLKKLNLLSYNYKETVMKTWNSPEVIGKEKTFEEDLDNDDSDIKDIEDIFLKTDYEENNSESEDSVRPTITVNKKKIKAKEIEV